MTIDEQMSLLRKGTVECIPEDELQRKLERSKKTRKPLRVKADPTAPDIHLGHTVLIRKVRHQCYIVIPFLLSFALPMLGLTGGALVVNVSDAPVLANSHPVYQELRKLELSGDTATVSGLVLTRDAATFTFQSGAFHFVKPAAGKVTGAVFIGSGSFTMTPPTEIEKRNLSLFTKERRITEEFSQLVLRFTDQTYVEIKQQAAINPGVPNSQAADLLGDTQKNLRNKLHYNLSGRILQDVLSEQTGGLFVAFIKGKKYGDKLQYAIDPFGNELNGELSVAPEEVALSNYDESRYGIWAAFHLQEEYAAKKATSAQETHPIDIESQKIHTEIEKNGKLNGEATTTFLARTNGVRVVPLMLFPTLRVQSVVNSAGDTLPFVQENKDEDPQLFVVLPHSLAAGERYTVKSAYSGSGVVLSEGYSYYIHPAARDQWYPTSHFGDASNYEMTFRIPKGLMLVATGVPVSDRTEGEYNISVWRSETPYRTAGFNFGRFKKEEAKNEKLGFTFEAYDFALGADMKELSYRNEAGKTMLTTVMKKTLAEAKVAVDIYTDYFGPGPYTRLAMTQQGSASFGQSWPSLTYLPTGAFSYPVGASSALGYFRAVGPHEIAHQWWGHGVGWNSYRDQWISEGFSDFSASLFIQATYAQQDQDRYFQFWKDERQLLTERNEQRTRAIDVGPLTLGYRLNSRKSGFDIARRLIYPKGAFVLQMIRMLLWDNKTKDERFKSMMHDFVRTYSNKVATTEDFKAITERHMTDEMDLQGNGKMDWFFDQYVYGTALPHYKLDYSLGQNASGQPTLNLKIEQSSVDDGFVMRVPIYLEFKSAVARLGSVVLRGNTVFTQSVPLTNLSERPKRVALNYYYDVLCTQ